MEAVPDPPCPLKGFCCLHAAGNTAPGKPYLDAEGHGGSEEQGHTARLLGVTQHITDPVHCDTRLAAACMHAKGQGTAAQARGIGCVRHLCIRLDTVWHRCRGPGYRMFHASVANCGLSGLTMDAYGTGVHGTQVKIVLPPVGRATITCRSEEQGCGLWSTAVKRSYGALQHAAARTRSCSEAPADSMHLCTPL